MLPRQLREYARRLPSQTQRAKGARRVVTSDDDLRKQQWHGFSSAWELCYRKIYAMRVVRGTTDPEYRAIKRVATWIRWLGSAFVPPLLGCAVFLTDGHAATTSRATLLLVMGAINAGALAAAVLAWGYALRRSETVDDLLRSCLRRDWVVQIIRDAVTHKWQLVLPVGLASVPLLIALVVGKPQSWAWSSFIVLVANSSWTLAIVGHVSHWLVFAPAIAIRLRKCPDILLRWNDPARTPGIRTLSEGYAYSAMFLALAAFSLTLPGLVGRPAFGPYLPYLYMWVILLSLWVGVMTQTLIYMIVRRARLRLLDELTNSPELTMNEWAPSRIRELINERPQVDSFLSVYSVLSGAPSLPYGTTVVVQYLAAVTGSFLGFLLQ